MLKHWSARCRFLVLAAGLVAISAAGFARPVVAQQNDRKPVAVVSVAGSGELLGDIEYLTEAAGVGDIGRLVTLMASPYTATLDKAKPSGALIYMNEDSDEPTVLGFVPVKNLEILLSALEDQVGLPEDAGDGVLEIGTDRPESMFVKETTGWAFFSNAKENLKELPKNPAKLLGGLDEAYTVAVRLDIRQIPEKYRKRAIKELREGFEGGLPSDLDDDQAEVARKLGESWVEQLVRVINESQDITIGWEIDAAGERTFLDFAITAVPGSKLASDMALVKDAKSNFSGFLMPDAAVTAHINGATSKDEIEQVELMLNVFRDELMKSIDEDDDLENEQERDEAKAIVGQFLDIAADTIQAGKIEAGLCLMLKPEGISAAAGVFVADGPKLGETVRQLLKFAEKKDPNFPGIEFETEKYGKVNLRTTRVPLDSGDRRARELLGDPMEVTVGISKKAAFVAFGKDSADLLKAIIDRSKEQADTVYPPAQVNIALTPIVEFAAEIDDNPALLLALETLKQAEGKDRVRIEAKTIKNGLAYRLELEKGVLQVIGEIGKALAPLATAIP